MNNTYHVPVLLKESINGLNILPNGVYVDATFGGGGHTKEILNHLNSSGKVIAFDQDADAIENQIDDNRLKLIKSNFKYITNHLKYLKINKIDGLLADFGISSYQIDTQIRGFSIRFDSDLDMRMNKDQKKIKRWDNLIDKLSKSFNEGEIIDLEGVIYLIVIQELGKFDKKFKKDEKVNLMHIAICKLLEPYGYYKFEFVDEDGWPHYSLNSKLPKLKPGEQSILMKESIISYFLKKGFIN